MQETDKYGRPYPKGQSAGTSPFTPERGRIADPPPRKRKRPVFGSQEWAETRGDDLGESPDY